MMYSDTSGNTNNVHGTLYSRLLDLNNLREAFANCSKRVRWKSSVQRYEANVLMNINKLRKELDNKTYRQKPFHKFDLNERGKLRHIKSLHISDRVLQRTLCDYVLLPELSNYLIYDNGASIKDKGVHFARNRLKAHLEKYYRQYGNKGYALRIDFRRFFDSIPHDGFMKLLSEKIQDPEVLELVRYLLSTNSDTGRSVGIGSQLSQVVGTFYPTPIDNYCKIVKRCKYYDRYQDDISIIHHSKEFLKTLLVEIRKIVEELGLTINENKTQIYRIDKGFVFLKIKYILSDSGKVVMIPCKDSFVREKKRLKKLKRLGRPYEIIDSQYRAWKGNLMKYDCREKLRAMDVFFKELYDGYSDY